MNSRLRNGALALAPVFMLFAAVGCAHKKPPPPPVQPTAAAEPTGACCAQDGTCMVTTQANCASPSTWQGKDTSCSPNPCTQPPPPPPPSAPAMMQDAYFDFDKSDIRSDARDSLNVDGQALVAHKDVKVLLEGHCDERGTVEYNLALGQRRADSAKNYLSQYGVDAGQLSTISYGEERPFASGHDEKSWQLNRRVHFVKQ